MVLPLISAEYREQNRQLHEQDEFFGSRSAKHFDSVKLLCDFVGSKNVLDYGCGKGSLVKALRSEGYDASGYDPAIEIYSGYPEPADVVICTDVLEHIEPERLDAVLDELQRLTKKAAFFLVATTVAKRTLPDGRNAHLIVKHSNWWLFHLMKRFVLVQFNDSNMGFKAVVKR